MYRLIRPLLFLLDAEKSHVVIFQFIALLYRIPGMRLLLRALYKNRTPPLPVDIMGLHFPNPVGLAAGLDKNATFGKVLSDLGFGWLELGTVTPQPQDGNPRPRLFRLAKHAAIINRMGFNNVGVARFIENLTQQRSNSIVGINIGKNRSTSNENAVRDYLTAMNAVYTHAGYIAINISSPNTPNLRDLQGEEYLDDLLEQLKAEHNMLAKSRQVYVPLAVKISPDLQESGIRYAAQLIRKHKIDAVIATNTTLSRDLVQDHTLATETGGLSGRPLKELSTNTIRILYEELQGEIPIIGVGGIENDGDAWEKLLAGADVLQVYSALIYQGPAVVRHIVSGLHKRVQALGCGSLKEAVEKARGGIRLVE